MKRKYNLALFGAGEMAEKIAEAAIENERLFLYSVASRNVENAKELSKEYKIQYVYDCYEDMLNDDQIDLVYISTPTRLHYKHIKMCLLAGKNVICEKPFVENMVQAEELIALAKTRELLLIDALWTMYMPIMEQLVKSVDEIGEIKFSTASLGYPNISYEESKIIKVRYDLWDYEVYPLATTLLLRGEPLNIKSKTKKIQNIAVKNKAILSYEKGISRIRSSLLHRSTYVLFVCGRKGIIIARKWWFGRFPMIVWKYPFNIEVFKFEHAINGYEYELKEAIYCLDNGLKESQCYPFERTITAAKWAEKLML